MERYFQASRSWFLNEQTLEFVPKDKVPLVADIDIPWYRWSFNSNSDKSRSEVEFMRNKGKPDARPAEGTIRKTYVICLRDFMISSTPKSSRYKIIGVVDKDALNITLDVVPNVTPTFNVFAVEFTALVNGTSVPSEHLTIAANYNRIEGLDKLWDNTQNPFAQVPYTMGARNGIWTDTSMFSYGLMQKQIKVYYRNKLLGKSLVYMFGAWAVILDDDLRFDALAVIDGCEAEEISIKRFLYTVNPYIVKKMVMLK